MVRKPNDPVAVESGHGISFYKGVVHVSTLETLSGAPVKTMVLEDARAELAKGLGAENLSTVKDSRTQAKTDFYEMPFIHGGLRHRVYFTVAEEDGDLAVRSDPFAPGREESPLNAINRSAVGTVVGFLREREAAMREEVSRVVADEEKGMQRKVDMPRLRDDGFEDFSGIFNP